MTEQNEADRAAWRFQWAIQNDVPLKFVETEEAFQKLLDFIRRQP